MLKLPQTRLIKIATREVADEIATNLYFENVSVDLNLKGISEKEVLYQRALFQVYYNSQLFAECDINLLKLLIGPNESTIVFTGAEAEMKLYYNLLVVTPNIFSVSINSLSYNGSIQEGIYKWM